MTKLNGISIKDMERLCAYMDNALSSKEKARFEEILAKDSTLQQALREQTILRNAVRALPVKKAPRNFTLTQNEARSARRNNYLLPLFSWASLAAVLLLAVMFAGEFIFKHFSVPAAKPAAELPMAALSETTQSTTQDTSIPIILNWGYGAYAKGIGGGAGMGGGGDSLSSGPVGIPLGNPATPESTMQTTQTPGLLRSDQQSASSVPMIFGIRNDQLGQVLKTYPPRTTAAQASAPAPEKNSQPALLISNNLKIAVAGLAVVFGLLAFLIYKKR